MPPALRFHGFFVFNFLLFTLCCSLVALPLAQIPDAVTQYFLGQSGYQSTDPRVTRIASIAAHKFVADLTNDALRICKQKQQGKGQGQPVRLVLTTEDLSQSARDYGINIRKPVYFADAPAPRVPDQPSQPR